MAATPIRADVRTGLPGMLERVVPAVPPRVPDWVRLEREGRIDDALDSLFEHVDELLLSGRFADCDRLLDDVTPAELGTDLLIGLLTVTLPACGRLRRRADLFSRISTHLRRTQPTRADRLLKGLEGTPDGVGVGFRGSLGGESHPPIGRQPAE